ncbi:MAG: DUF4258 domain-containing protein [Magnetococcales bacterium]|nr:DUF4258 domain-containing protein [Magnetococcales bacterium]
MNEWYSKRFKQQVILTDHAQARMAERGINIQMVVDIIETGEKKFKNERSLWLSKGYPDRDDNLICAAVVLEDAIVIKTVMHKWKLEEIKS